MKRSAFKRTEFLNHIYNILIILVMTLGAVTITTRSFTFAEQDAKTTQPAPVQDSKSSDVRELKLGESVERELAGGEAHSYLITLVAGQYLKTVVEQKGIDVVVRLFGPNGEKLAEVDSPNGTQGPEPVSYVTEESGKYQFQVKSLEAKAPRSKYAVKIEELRQSTTEDRDHVAAHRAFVAGEQFRVQGTADALRKSIEKYNEALQLFRKVRDSEGEATTLSEIGRRYWDVADHEKALDHLNQALLIWRHLGNSKEAGRVLSNIGGVYWQKGDSQKALVYHNQALPMIRTGGERTQEAITLHLMGIAYSRLGQLREALDYLYQALALQRSIGNRRDEATTLNSLGATYARLGNWQKALDYSLQSLPLRKSIGDRRGEAATLNNTGAIYWQLGNPEKALEYYNQALQLRRETGDRPGEISTLSNIAVAYRRINELQSALKYFAEALTLARAVGDRGGEAIILQETGVVYQLLGKPETAHEYYNRSLLLRQNMGDKRGEAITLFCLGENYVVWGKPREALDYLRRALAMNRAVGDQGYEVITLRTIVRAERDLDQLNDARANAEAALSIVESTRSTVANQDLRTSYLAANKILYELYIDVLMRLHRQQPSAGHDAAALKVSQRARARSLLDLLAESSADIRQGVDPALLERERSLQQELNAQSATLTRLLSSKHTEEQATRAKRQVADLVTQYQQVEAQIRAKSPRYAALTQPEPLSSQEIQRLLDKDTMLLEYSLGEEKSYLWVVTPVAVRSFELPKRKEIEDAAKRLYDLIIDSENRRIDAQEAAASALSHLLLAPVASLLDQKRLVIVSDGSLQYVSFAALPIPVVNEGFSPVNRGVRNKKKPATQKYEPLIVKHEIVQVPSASVLSVLRKQATGRAPAPSEVAVLADPVFQSVDPRIQRPSSSTEEPPNTGNSLAEGNPQSDVKRSAWESGLQDLQRLPFSRREAESIVALASARGTLKALDFDASHATMTNGKLAQYRIVHLATHSLLNNVHPELSGIVLSLVDEAGRPQNGFLRLHEIFNLSLPVELVVLSGCRTALGKQIKGEGLVGLTHGFMYAGTPRLVVSLWDVSDEATAELMKRFYEAMLKKGMRPAAALRQAQLSMWKDKWWQAPYYWAGFVMQGEWR